MNNRSETRRVSIKDIAQAVGVSHSTVSRALNDSPLINETTRARIQAAAREMGYIPNAVARGLKSQRSGTVGLVVTSLTDPFFAEVMAGVDAVASEDELSMFVTASHNDPEREMAVIETFHRRRVDGIIVAASRLSHRHRSRLAKIRVPIVLLNQHTDEAHPDFRGVAFDERAGARLAVEHLLALGHRRIGYLGLGNRQRSNRLRLAGYREALGEAGISAPDRWTLVIPERDIGDLSDHAAGEQAVHRLLHDAGTGRRNDISAVLCYNDRTAAGALTACHRHGITVPDDLSLVGFDDIELARWITPSLTSIRQPRAAMGRAAMEMLLQLLAGEAVENRLVAPELIARESTAVAG